MVWDPLAHSDEENLRWSWLRAVEWGRWPLFISQPIAPLLLLALPWPTVVLGAFAANVLWAAFVRYRLVSVSAADWAAIFVRLKWFACIGSAAYLLASDNKVAAAVALFWPIVIFPLGILTPVGIGRIQSLFMVALGYERGRGA